MSVIKRLYLEDFEKNLEPNRVLVIYGARRVGKTTLVQEYLQQTPHQYLCFNGDDLKTQMLFGSLEITQIEKQCAGYDLIFIDEAQNIPKIGKSLKLLVDTIPKIRVIATGSSSFDLANKVGEPLVGRKKTRLLYPISQLELKDQYRNRYEQEQDLSKYLRYGSYPEVLTKESEQEKIDYLHEISESYLYKDILDFKYVKRADIILKLLKLLAFQIGSEVSLNELSKSLGVDLKTIDRYLYLLEKSFVIFRLQAFSRNLRNELGKSKKYYFYDLGIRNAIISNFNDLDTRSDLGALWENFCLVERYKRQEYLREFANKYFWRTYTKTEIDYLEERGGSLYAYEFKWNQKTRAKLPKAFAQTYQNHNFQVVTPENYLEFMI